MKPARRLRVGQLFGLSMGALVLVTVAGLAAGILAYNSQREKRRVLADRVDPARIAAESFLTALVDQETGVRGFALGGTQALLEPFTRGMQDAQEQLAILRRLGLEREGVEAVGAAATRWRTEYAEPVIAERGAIRLAQGQRLFAAVRAEVAELESALDVLRITTRAELSDASEQLRTILIALAITTLLSVLLAFVVLRRTVVVPTRRLADQVRAVAEGDFSQHVEVGGAREIAELGADVEAMRARVVSERDDLARSNAELEQFAYVASHDLQEPLRKVASFTRMLQHRYHGQLDERADQYIDFAVDGAKRMQDLINDLLSFSRVGRMGEPVTEVDCNVLMRAAMADVDLAGVRVETGDLPTLRGEARLLQLVFANLLSNAVKFRGEPPPVIRVTAEREDGLWCFTVADNGIGVGPEYAERIFIIFQRLHPREAYIGTGIGLAMCRKIVEYHGGKIWLDTTATEGATFRFTLPAA